MRLSGRLTRFMDHTDYQVPNKRTKKNSLFLYFKILAGKRPYCGSLYTLLPLHFSFCRTTLKKETSGNAASGRVFFASRMLIVHPLFTRIGWRPSKVRKTGYSGSLTSISMIDVSATIIERFVSTCGQIAVITRTPDSGSRIGPPAESEYAVEPVGVATIKPSALNSVSASPLTRVRNNTKRESSPRLKTASFRAVILLVRFPPTSTLASRSVLWLKLIRSFAMHSTASR